MDANVEEPLRGRLKVFFGMCDGVGKTYGMLLSAREAQLQRIDVVVGWVDTHGKKETETLLDGLSVVPRKSLQRKGIAVEQMDLDAILGRRPALVIVDELATTNAAGSRHRKRYAEVFELLDNGIDVYTTLSVEQLESRAESAAQITGLPVRETVPDSVLDRADDLELIDISPDKLLARFNKEKKFSPDRSDPPNQNHLRKGTLTALREMALRAAAELVDSQLRDYMRSKNIARPWKSGQRLIVGISESPHSAHLIRWSRRLASTLGSTWVAVHVETSRTRTRDEEESLAKNISLARDLGAEIISTADENVAGALLRVAARENCTQILVGKARPGWFGRQGKFLSALIEQSGDLDIHVVGGDENHSEKPFLRIPRRNSPRGQYLLAAGAVTAVMLACLPFAQTFGYQSIGLLLLSAVALLSLRLGIGPVLLAAVISALGWDYIFIPPVFTFSIGRFEDAFMLIMYFCIASVTGILTSRARAQEKAVRQREERAVALYTLSRELEKSRSRDQVVASAVKNIRTFFRSDSVVFLGKTDGDIFTEAHPSSTLNVDEKDFAVAAWVYWNEKKAGRFTDTLSGARATFYPLSGPRYPLGVLGISSIDARPLTIDQETLLENFLSQISSAIERETLNELTKKAIVIEESERLYKTLFDSLSHEMKTPLAAMIGAAEHLSDQRMMDDVGSRKRISSEIHEAAERLNRLFENLLDITRIESGLLRPKLDWCEIQDIINEARRRIETQLSTHTLSVEIPADMPLVRVDFVLIEQALINLLLNACAYTPADSHITVRARVSSEACTIIVSDNGPGFPAGEEEKVFGKFYRAAGTTAGGTGLGLGIVRGFVEAHRGTVKAGNRTGGGAEFTIQFPRENPPQAEGTP